MDFAPDKWPRIDDKLRLFIAHVEHGRTPPDWLLQFMADGAREFLKGGKAWQKGKGGAPKSGYGQKELEAYALNRHGGLSFQQIVQLRDFPDDGKDRAKTIERQVERGKIAFCMAQTGQVADLKALFSDLAKLPFDCLSVEARDRCRAKLLAERDRLGRDEQEPGYE